MNQSFRLRLALFSAALAGLTLALFIFSSFWLIQDAKIEHIDRALRSHAERETGRPPHAFDWTRVERDIASSLGLEEPRDLLLLIQDPQGHTAYRSRHWPADLDPAHLPWPRLPTPAGDELARPRPIALAVGQTLTGQDWRWGLAVGNQAQVGVAVNLRTLGGEMRGVRIAFLAATPVALFLIGLGAWLFSKRALRPIYQLTTAARQVTAKGLDQRLPVSGSDREFAELIEVFNRMLERLERSFEQAQRFSGDAAHELKTPLAILHGQLERAIQDAEAGSAEQAKLAGILDQVRRLTAITRKLLLLAQADAGRLRLQRQAFSLSQALKELVEDTQMLAPHLQVSADIPDGIQLVADPSLIQQILHNLIGNAIKYNLDPGWIQVAARAGPDQVQFWVTNPSAGIPPNERERIFKRFHRTHQATQSQTEGVGLGLALAREIARAHGGDLSLDVGTDGAVRLTCRLPRAG